MKERIYNPEEINQIIRRAVELGSKESKRTKGDEGLTMGELEDIVSDTGIDPQLLQIAANELDGISSKSSNRTGKTKVRGNDISTDRWFDFKLNQESAEMIITELNHQFNASEDVKWWNEMFESYDGKARVNYLKNSIEWIYTDSMGHYSTKVLFQERGERTRIRFSRTNEWINWQNGLFKYILPIPFFVIFFTLSSYLFLDNAILGLILGVLAGSISMPFIGTYIKYTIHKQEGDLNDLADDISQLYNELVHEKKSRGKTTDEKDSKIRINIDDDNPRTESRKSSLRNELR